MSGSAGRRPTRVPRAVAGWGLLLLALLVVVAVATSMLSTGARAATTGGVAGTPLPQPFLDRQDGDKLIGRACGGCIVNVFLADGLQFLGEGPADSNGFFSIGLPCDVLSGSFVATAKDGANESAFSDPLETPGTSSCGTDTPGPVDTPVSTDTPVPTDTPSGGPTDTPVPTDTPQPGDTPVPTDTPVPGEASPTVVPTPGATGTPEGQLRELNVDIRTRSNIEKGETVLLTVEVTGDSRTTFVGGDIGIRSVPTIEGESKTWSVYFFGESGLATLELQLNAGGFDFEEFEPKKPITFRDPDAKWDVILVPKGNQVGRQDVLVKIYQLPPPGEELPQGLVNPHERVFFFTIEGESKSSGDQLVDILKWALPGGIVPILLLLAGLNWRRLTSWFRSRSKQPKSDV